MCKCIDKIPTTISAEILRYERTPMMSRMDTKIILSGGRDVSFKSIFIDVWDTCSIINRDDSLIKRNDKICNSQEAIINFIDNYEFNFSIKSSLTLNYKTTLVIEFTETIQQRELHDLNYTIEKSKLINTSQFKENYERKPLRTIKNFIKSILSNLDITETFWTLSNLILSHELVYINKDVFDVDICYWIRHDDYKSSLLQKIKLNK